MFVRQRLKIRRKKKGKQKEREQREGKGKIIIKKTKRNLKRQKLEPSVKNIGPVKVLN